MPDYHFDVEPLPGYLPEYGLLLAALLDSTREWKGELEDVDQDLICWQPYPNAYSIGGVLLHIAEVEAYWIEDFSLGRKLPTDELERYMSAEIDPAGGSWPTPPREPLGYYYEILDSVRARTLDSVKDLEAPSTIKRSKWGTMTLRWVLAHVVGHDSYHGGQAVMLKELGLRLRSQ